MDYLCAFRGIYIVQYTFDIKLKFALLYCRWRLTKIIKWKILNFRLVFTSLLFAHIFISQHRCLRNTELKQKKNGFIFALNEIKSTVVDRSNYIMLKGLLKLDYMYIYLFLMLLNNI